MKKTYPLIGFLSFTLLASCTGTSSTTPSATLPPSTTQDTTTTSVETTTPATTTPTTTPETTTSKPTTPDTTTTPDSTSSAEEPDSTSSSTTETTDSQTSSTGSEESSESSSSGGGDTPGGDVLTDEVLAPYKQGFAARTTFHKKTAYSWGGDSEDDYFGEVRVGTGAIELLTYSVDSWEEVTPEKNPTQATHYEEKDGNGYIATINGSNKVAYETLYVSDPLLPDSYYPGAWGEDGLGLDNFFALLDVDDFVSKGDGVYELDKAKAESRVLDIIPRQLYPDGGTTSNEVYRWEVENDIDTLTLTVKDGAISTMDIVLAQSVNTSGSTISGTMTCEITDFGPSVVSKLTPFEEKYPEFQELMQTLAKGNWKVVYDYEMDDPWWSTSNHEEGTADGTNAQFHEYSGSNIKATHSFYQSTETSFQSVVPVGEAFYVSGAPIEGSIVKDILPKFDISSAFLTKTTKGDKDIYTISYPDFDFLVKSNVGQFYKRDLSGAVQLFQAGTITHDKAANTVTFFNQFNDTTTYTVVYTDIGKVATPIFTDVKTNADELSWKEVLSLTEEDESAIDTMFGAGVLDKIPTLGGIYPVATPYIDARNSILEISYSMGTTKESLANLEIYKAKFEALEAFESIPVDPEEEENTYIFQNKSISKTISVTEGETTTDEEVYLTVTIQDRYGDEIRITIEFAQDLSAAA